MNFWSVLLISLVYFYSRTAGSVPQKLPESWKCADPKCSVPISEARPLLKQYNSLRNLSLRKYQKVIIYGKGSKTYAVEVDGKRGHIPKHVVIETRVFIKDTDLKFIVTSDTNDNSSPERRSEINVKTPLETIAEPTIDLVNLKPDMAPVMQGAFLLAGAAADDSGMKSPPKIPDAIPDAFKNSSPTEDEKPALDAPAEVYESEEVDLELQAGLSEDDNVAFDVDENITGTTDGALKDPVGSVPSIDIPADTENITVDSLNDTSKLEPLNETGVEAPVTTDVANDTAPEVLSDTKNEGTDVKVAESESAGEIPQKATVEQGTNTQNVEGGSADFAGGFFGFLEAALDSLEDAKEEADEDVEGDVEKEVVGEVKEKVEIEKKEEVEIEKKEEVGIGMKEEVEIEKKEEVEIEKKEESAEQDVVDEEFNLTDKEVPEAVKLPVGIEIDVGAEKVTDESKLEDTAGNLTAEVEKPVEVEAAQTMKIVETRIEETRTETRVESRIEKKEPEQIVESVEKVLEQDFKLESNESEGIEADNATNVEPSVYDAAALGGISEEKVDKYGGIPKQEEENKEEVRSRVKRDFMYQQNQYAYNAHPSYQQQQRNYGGRMNEYNTNNYRQYQTEYPNAYAYQQHGNYEGNMHHNMEANMHRHNAYQATQQPYKVETSTAKKVEPSIPVTTTQEPQTTPEEPVVSKKPDYEDVSVEVDDHSGEVVTDSYPKVEEKVDSTTEVPTSSETMTEELPSLETYKEERSSFEITTEVPTITETATISEPEVTDQPEVVHEEEKVEVESPQDEVVVTSEEVAESGGGWFNIKAITDLFSSEKSAEVVADLKSDETAESSLPSSGEEAKVTDEKCSSDDVNCELNKLEEKLLHGDLPTSDEFISESDDLLGALMESLQRTSSGPIFCLIVTACAVVGFSLGYNFIENRKREGELVAKINSLEKENLVEKKEKSQLKDKLLHVSEASTLSSEAESSYLSQIAALTEERDTLIAEKRDLEDQLMETERELQTATESNLEMNNLLSESLSTPDGSTVLLETVDKLKAKLENQNAEVKELNRLLNEKSEEIDSIRKELKAAQEAKKSLQEKLTTLKREKDEEMLQLKETNRDLSTQLDDLMESKSLEKLKLSNELSKLQITLTETQTILGDRNGEIDALKDVISRLKTDLKEDELNSLYDVASVTGKLTQAEAERDCFKEKFLEEEGARKLLEGHVQVISQEVASLKENYEAAEKEKIDALTKVQVLSNYFKEKETQLQKELGLKESMWLQKQSDDNTIYEQMKSLREENERYKSQLESLQKEIRESETDYKSQIAKAEQKSYENWLTSRQYERKLKESQGEATQLRNMLTMIEKNSTNHSTDDLKQSISEVSNGGDPSSPPPRFLPPPPTSPPFMMFQPPPHHDFVPPPPLYPPAPLPPEASSSSSSARPPTLGRISSPPLHDPRFSPPYMFEPPMPPPHFHPQHSPSPPPPHRPMPKPPPPHLNPASDQKESMSPGYSEHHERPNRRSKR